MWALWMAAAASASIIFSVEVCRHGARAPNQIFPFHSEYWRGYEPGQLTALGQRQAYLLGVELRRRYVEDLGLFNSTYHPREVKVQSTDVDRTLETAYAQLSGLFPAGTGLRIPAKRVLRPPFPVRDIESIEKELGTQALPFQVRSIPIHSNDSDHVLHGYKDSICPRMAQIKANIKLLPEHAQIEERARALQTDYNHLIPEGGLKELKRLYSGLACDQAQGNPIPPGIDLEALRQLHRDLVVLPFNDPEGQVLSCSEFFKRLLAQFEERLAGGRLRFVLNSAHDYTLLAFMSCLGADIPDVPVFSSSLLFELYADLTISLLFNGTVLPCAACPGGHCPLDLFKAYIRRFTVSDIDQACEPQ
jgi:hypothetical protein